MSQPQLKGPLVPLVLFLLAMGGLAAFIMADGGKPSSPDMETPWDTEEPAETRTTESAPAFTGTVEVPDSDPAERSGVIPPNSPFNVHAPQGKGILRGQVVSSKWVQFPTDVKVVLTAQAETEAAGAERELRVSEETPTFRFDDVPFGHWQLSLRSPGYQEQGVLVSLSDQTPDRHILLSLLPANHIKGRVLDDLGRPRSGVPVTAVLQSEDKSIVPRPLVGSTDSEGNFDITGASQGLYRVHPGNPRNPMGDFRELQLVGQEGWIELIVPVTGSATVEVLDIDKGEGLAGVKVVATKTGQVPGGAERGHADEVYTNDKGEANFGHLPPGDYAFTVYGRNYRRAVKNSLVLADQRARLRVELKALE